jgi:hypothetical protein
MTMLAQEAMQLVNGQLVSVNKISKRKRVVNVDLIE